MTKKAKRPAIARLTMVVEWTNDMDMPDHSDVEEILDKAKEYAAVIQATFETLTLTKKELV
jgi:hypothetical protein